MPEIFSVVRSVAFAIDDLLPDCLCNAHQRIIPIDISFNISRPFPDLVNVVFFVRNWLVDL